MKVKDLIARATGVLKQNHFEERSAEALRQFQQYLVADLGLQETTARCYVHSLRPFLKTIGTVRPSRKQVQDYVYSMRSRGASHSHVRNTIKAIDHYTTMGGHRIRVKTPKKPRRILHDVLSEEEIVRLLRYAKDDRERAIVAVLAWAGLRTQELCNLLVKDVDLRGLRILVRGGKNGKDRVVSISPQCAEILQEYLEGKDGLSPNSYFFRKKTNGKPLDGYILRKSLRYLAKRARIEKPVYPHLFRHSLASHMAAKGVPLIVIQHQLGHEHIETTEQYLSGSSMLMGAAYQAAKVYGD